MAGHSHAKNVAHKKNAADKKRAKIFTQLQKEITVAVKEGGIDEKFNPKLRLARQKARFCNMPNNKILDAMKRATSSSSDNENYEEIYYLASFSGGVVILIKALTDNKTRTASEVRSILSKFSGTLEGGKIDSFFMNVGAIYYSQEGANFDALFEEAVEAGAFSIENISLLNEASENENEENYCQMIEILCNFKDFISVKNTLEEKFGEAKMAEKDFRPHRKIEILGDAKEKFQNIFLALEGSDDVSTIYKNF